MPAVDAGVVFLPRYTTLVGGTSFATAPLDVSRQGGVQFQFWQGGFRGGGGNSTLTVYLEESLDGQAWVLGPSLPDGTPVPAGEERFFSYSFRLRWFRLRVLTTGADSMVTCWAEGLLRAGADGVWGGPRGVAPSPHGAVPEASRGTGRSPLDDWKRRQYDAFARDFRWDSAALLAPGYREAALEYLAQGRGGGVPDGPPPSLPIGVPTEDLLDWMPVTPPQVVPPSGP